jgi:hypothetical protein
MWQETGKTTPVTANGQSVGAITSKWGTGAFDGLASTALRPIRTGGNALDFDGTDDYFEVTPLTLLNNKPAGFACARVLADDLAIERHIVGISALSGSQARLGLSILTTGEVEFVCRTINASTSSTFLSAAGTIVAGQAYVITAQVDYAGTRAANVWVNGVSVISGTLTQAASNTSATNSARFWIAADIVSGDRFNGRMGRMVFADKLMTTGQRASIEGWVGEGALT